MNADFVHNLDDGTNHKGSNSELEDYICAKVALHRAVGEGGACKHLQSLRVNGS